MTRKTISCTLILLLSIVLLIGCSNKEEKPLIFVNPDYAEWFINPPYIDSSKDPAEWISKPIFIVYNRTDTNITVTVRVTLYADLEHTLVNKIKTVDVDVPVKAKDNNKLGALIRSPFQYTVKDFLVEII